MNDVLTVGCQFVYVDQLVLDHALVLAVCISNQ
jgi:hypothetical protein